MQLLPQSRQTTVPQTQTISLCPLQSTSPPGIATATNLVSTLKGLFSIRVQYEWSYIVGSPLSQASFTYIMHSKVTHVDWSYWEVSHCMDIPWFDNSTTSWKALSCFQIFDDYEKATITITYRFLCGCKFSLLRWIPSSMGLLDGMVNYMFHLTRNNKTVSQHASTILHCHQQWRRVPVAMH